jgi:hypothetical protein
VLDKLRKVGNYMRKGWHSTNPDSYSHFKRGREHERKQEERGRKEADRSAELGREEAQRGREYEERYAAERGVEEPQTEGASGRHRQARMILAQPSRQARARRRTSPRSVHEPGSKRL